jgi:hypothetical protein
MPGVSARACVANIGPAQRRRRQRTAVAAFAVAAAAAALMFFLDIPRGWRALLFPPLWLGALCVYQVRLQTCVFLADRGVRNMDAGAVAIDDSAELAVIRAQARSVRRQTLGLAILLTLIVLLLP